MCKCRHGVSGGVGWGGAGAGWHRNRGVQGVCTCLERAEARFWVGKW
jgi:hypothetical protein